MKYQVLLTRNAQRDRDRVVAWYDAEAADQSERFVDEFYATARRREDFPYSGPVALQDARRVNLRVFPYQIWYRVHDGARIVEIIAVLHHRQDLARMDDRIVPPSNS